MRWSNVKLIFTRELRDQLRDRRTLFTVLVLPLLLYPLMGMALLQVSQFMREHPTKIWVVGLENLPDEPSLLVDGELNSKLIPGMNPDLVQLLHSGKDDQEFLNLIEKFKSENNKSVYSDSVIDRMLQREMKNRAADLAVVIPRKIPSRSDTDSDDADSDDAPASEADLGTEAKSDNPTVYIFRNSASDKSNIAAERFNSLISNWQRRFSDKILEENNLTRDSMKSFAVAHADVADESWKKAATWSKILPFIVLIWSLTGAFYPAVDLCAGEKERGTLETLLSSPAARNEIAIGKLLTVMAFSMVTSLLNLLSMGFTGIFVISRLTANVPASSMMAQTVGLPPLSSIGWLLLALIPISALFSALALAAASFARSSKEGQSYLVPLMMICMPLMMLPMMPAAKLDLGTSLIPVSGLMLMLRGLIEGQFAETINYAGPVCIVTLTCCWLAIRWVVVQFNSEKVLFRPSERFGLGVWVKEIFRTRTDLPLASHAIMCGVGILVLKFFIGLGISENPSNWFDFSKQTIIVLVATIAIPALLMAMFLTHRPRKSLKLNKCSIPVACAAVLTALCLHPAVMWLTAGVMTLYPPTGDMHMIGQMMSGIMNDAPGLWAILLVFAVAPAVIEELAFRGFILSGLQSLGSNLKAILISSILFGIAHSILQQSIITFFVGLVIGFIAVRTASLIPCILFHFTHNATSVILSMVDTGTMQRFPLLSLFLEPTESGIFQYALVPGIMMAALGVLLLAWFWNYGKPVGDDNDNTRAVFNPERARMLQTFVSKISTK